MVKKLSTRSERFSNRQLAALQSELAKTQGHLNTCPFLAGNLVKAQTFAAGTPLTINHGLGATPQGCIVVRSYGTNAAPPPVESTTQPADPTTQIRLQTTAVATFDLWFF